MTDIRYRHNVMEINSLLTFARIKGGFNNGCRDVYFIVLQGADATLKQDVLSTDKLLGSAMKEQKLFYKRVSALPGLSRQDEIDYYSACYNEWLQSENQYIRIKTTESNTALAERLGGAVKTVTDCYAESRKGISDSIKKNFAVKLMHWTDTLFGNDLKDWTDKSCIKIIAANVCRDMEGYFYYMLTLIGADVLLLQMNKDIELPDTLKQVSKRVVLGDYATWELTNYEPSPFDSLNDTVKQEVSQKEHTFDNSTGRTNVLVHIPKHERGNRQPPAAANASNVPCDKEKSFEQLALLAASVVMIAIHDNSGEITGSGSGIMIGTDGYILTNYHVVNGGRFFSVRLEEDETAYPTNEIIKYNTVLDLAIIRIQKKLMPIPVYKGKDKLVRGQKVVAIGSPLGLFNSVSDGIISGFREIKGVNMLQFTAPTSHGSSGGAVLNMYGEVIGISTAGIDSGQNINLAVQYDDINAFIRGF